MKLPADFAAFSKALDSRDDTGLVIRTHVHIEQAIRHIVHLAVPFPEHLPKLGYDAIVRLACALGMDPAYLAPLRALGNLRNQFGHHHDIELTEENVGALLNAFEKHERAHVVASYEDTRKARKIRGPVKFDKLHPYNKFVIIALCMRTWIDLHLEGLVPNEAEGDGAEDEA